MEYGLKNIFRFYDDKSKQNRYYDYVHGNLRTFKLTSNQYHFLAFQIAVPHGTVISDVAVYLTDLDGVETNVTSYLDTTGSDANLYIQSFTGDDYLIYNRHGNLGTLLPEGTYFLRVNDGSNNYYSEVFWIRSTTGYLILEYYNSTDIGAIDYTNPYYQFKNVFPLETKLVKPEYEYTEDGTEDGEGNFLPTFFKRTKKYRFVFYAPEYIVDAITLVPMCSNITVTTDYGESTSETITVEEFDVVDVAWTNSKGFAKITCEFRGDPVISTYYNTNIT